ncbi:MULTISPECIES: hypothetical protein [Pectobacterium]|uniref:hypothetical protein n=1 Tax=Pectobacterium TaxID=122277 RepID=UPI00227C34D9|nr:hypothetical protein [Pectobacterium brasiliense]WGL26860.1 hypothetical protein OWC53_16010 [Pectobacterium brasiliense]
MNTFKENQENSAQKIDVIDSPETAKMAAYAYAVRNGMDPVWLCAFASATFTTKITRTDFEISLLHFATTTHNATETWQSHADQAWQLHVNWAIETIKHIAIVHTAGLAGCAALLATDKTLRNCTTLLGTLCFSLGLLFIAITLHLGSTAYLKRAQDHHGRANSVRNSTSWEAYVAAQSSYQKDAGKRWTQYAQITGWAAASFAIIGVGLLIATLSS